MYINSIPPLVNTGILLPHVVQTRASLPNEKLWKTKAEIAEHFGIGQRTVTNLMRTRIFAFVKLQNLVRFDLAECERAFRHFKVASHVNVPRSEKERIARRTQWKTKHQIAEHYQISYRSVTTLMRRRILPYVKMGQLVRLDQFECDAVLGALKTSAIVGCELQTVEFACERI